jgi:hypothetical protein
MHDILVIPYATPSLDAAKVVVRDFAVECPVPFVAFDRRRDGILRLNGEQYAFPEAPDLRAMTDAASQLDFLHGHLQHYVDLWARPPRLFLERYFAFVTHCVDDNRLLLAERLEPFGSLFAIEDWALSAPRPLPRAQLQVGGAHYPVDFAFWLGDRVVAILLRGTATAMGQERHAALEAAGIEIVEIANTELVKAGPDYLLHKLPPEFVTFWSGEVMPSSPFKGTSLGDIVPVQGS